MPKWGFAGNGKPACRKLKRRLFYHWDGLLSIRLQSPKIVHRERITHTFYSYDPLAKASKKCGFDVSFLDFSNVPEGSPLAGCLSENVWMGSLGESYSGLMNFIPRSYRILRTPLEAYDAMIFVANATPIKIKPSAE